MRLIPLIPMLVESDDFFGCILVDLENNKISTLKDCSSPDNTIGTLTDENKEIILNKFKNNHVSNNEHLSNSLNNVQTKFQHYYNEFKNIKEKYAKPN